MPPKTHEDYVNLGKEVFEQAQKYYAANIQQAKPKKVLGFIKRMKCEVYLSEQDKIKGGYLYLTANTSNKLLGYRLLYVTQSNKPNEYSLIEVDGMSGPAFPGVRGGIRQLDMQGKVSAEQPFNPPPGIDPDSFAYQTIYNETLPFLQIATQVNQATPLLNAFLSAQ